MFFANRMSRIVLRRLSHNGRRFFNSSLANCPCETFWGLARGSSLFVGSRAQGSESERE